MTFWEILLYLSFSTTVEKVHSSAYQTPFCSWPSIDISDMNHTEASSHPVCLTICFACVRVCGYHDISARQKESLFPLLRSLQQQ